MKAKKKLLLIAAAAALAICAAVGAIAVNAADAGTFNGLPADVDANGNLLINEKNFPDVEFRTCVIDPDEDTIADIEDAIGASYQKIDANGDGVISIAEANAVTEIDCFAGAVTDSIESIAGIEYFPNLKTLDCFYTLITELDISHNTALEELDCSGTSITDLDVSHSANLKKLNCSEMYDLVSLDCSYCKLDTLDLTFDDALEVLNCSNNDQFLGELDLSWNESLRELNCSYNDIVELDLSCNPELTKLDCSKTLISELDISANTKLQYLDCSYNRRLYKIDLSKNVELAYADLSDCAFTYVDFSNTKVNESSVDVSNQEDGGQWAGIKKDGIITYDFTGFGSCPIENIERVYFKTYENGYWSPSLVQGGVPSYSGECTIVEADYNKETHKATVEFDLIPNEEFMFIDITVPLPNNKSVTLNCHILAGYVDMDEETDEPADGLVDENSGASAVFPEDEADYYTDVELKAEKDENNAEADKSFMDKFEEYLAYVVELIKDKMNVQPKSSLTVSLPVPTGWDASKTAVYYVTADGEPVDMNAKASSDGKYVSFATTHFSTYVLVNTATAISDPATSDPATTDPATTDPATTEPAATDPVGTEPAETEPATDPVTEPVTDPETEPSGSDTGAAEPPETGDGGFNFAVLALVVICASSAAAIVVVRKLRAK